MYVKFIHQYSLFAISLVYAFFVIQLPILHSIDSINYLNYPLIANSELEYSFSKSFLFFLFAEPIWLLVNHFLYDFIFKDPENVVLFISFFISVISCYYALKLSNNYIFRILVMFLLLLSPLFLANSVSHLRGGFAFSIFLIGFFSSKNSVRMFLLLITPFIHISFILIIIVYFYSTICKKYNISVFLSLSFIMLAAFLIYLFLNYLTDDLIRQASSISEEKIVSSGMGFLFWFIYLINLLVNKKIYNIENKSFQSIAFYFSVNMIVLYLSLYFIFYGAGRFLEVSLFFHFVAIFYLNNYGRIIAFNLLVIFTLLDWFLRFNSENLGF